MKIYFASHGTTYDNEAKLASGWKDDELSPLGRQQAAEYKDLLKDLQIDLIACSDQVRATETVRLAFGESLPVIADARLRELNYGDLNGAPKSDVDPAKINHITEPFPGGESYNDALARTHEFYNELKENHGDKNVLVVGSRATQHGLQTLVEGTTIEELLQIPFKWQPYWEYDW